MNDAKFDAISDVDLRVHDARQEAIQHLGLLVVTGNIVEFVREDEPFECLRGRVAEEVLAEIDKVRVVETAYISVRTIILLVRNENSALFVAEVLDKVRLGDGARAGISGSLLALAVGMDPVEQLGRGAQRVRRKQVVHHMADRPSAETCRWCTNRYALVEAFVVEERVVMHKIVLELLDEHLGALSGSARQREIASRGVPE